MATSEVAPRRAVRPSERVRHLRAADAGLPLLSRAGPAVGEERGRIVYPLGHE